MKLGIVPIALILGTLFGSGYGYYVYLQIQPRPVARRVEPPPAPPAPQVAMQPAQPTAATTPPAVQAPTPFTQPVQPVEQTGVTAHHHAPRKRSQEFVIERQPEADSLTPLLQAAYKEYRAGDLESAHRDYAAALHQAPQNRDALLGMAAIAHAKGEDALAAQYYDKLLTLDPRDPQAQAGMSALEKGNASGKESRLKLLLDQQPQSAALNFALGNLYAEQSRWAEAQQAYFNAYSLQPDAAQYAYNLGISLDHLGQRKPAAQYYERALQLDGSANAIDHAQIQQRLNELKAP
jgi:tetratricopeptide (TPR) repeat protein